MSVPKNLRRVEYEKNFLRQFAKLTAKAQLQARARIAEFIVEENVERLRDHALSGDFLGYRSINITGDVRALYYLSADGRLWFLHSLARIRNFTGKIIL